MRQYHPEHLRTEQHACQLLIERAVAERLLRDRGQAPRPGHDQAHGGRQLGLGPQQLLGIDQREQLGWLIPTGLGQVDLNLTDDRQQRAHADILAHEEPPPLWLSSTRTPLDRRE